MRGKADNNFWGNDSVWVQFSDAVDSTGRSVMRIDTASGTSVSIEQGSNAGVAGWGWADNAYGGAAPPIMFGVSGPQRIRIQVREDGVSLDQVVLSPSTYANIAPGAAKNDATILEPRN
jgi:hypothetical protein